MVAKSAVLAGNLSLVLNTCQLRDLQLPHLG